MNDETHVSKALEQLQLRLSNLEQEVNALSNAYSQMGKSLIAFSEEFIRQNQATRDALRYGQAVYLGNETALTLLQTGQKIFVDTRSVDIGAHLLLDGHWEPEETTVFQQLVREGDVVFDIGANHGYFALLAAGQVGEAGKVYAFEANPRLYNLCQMSISANGLGSIASAHFLAVGNEEGELSFSYSSNMPGGGHVSTSHEKCSPHWDGVDKQVKVPVLPLDEYFVGKEQTVDVIKIDVEGFEYQAFLGMKDILTRSEKARILFEYSPGMLTRYKNQGEELLGFLESLGFFFFTIEPEGVLRSVPAAQIVEKYVKGTVNLVAAKAEFLQGAQLGK